MLTILFSSLERSSYDESHLPLLLQLFLLRKLIGGLRPFTIVEVSENPLSQPSRHTQMPLTSGIRQTVLGISRSPRHTGTTWATAHSTSRELGWSPFYSDTTRFTGCRWALSLPTFRSTLICPRSPRFWVFPRPPLLLHLIVPLQKHLKEVWHWLAAVPGRILGRSRGRGPSVCRPHNQGI